MLKITKIILLFIIFSGSNVYAEIATPLGIEVAKATAEEVKNKYSISSEEKSEDGLRFAYSLATKNLPLENIKDVSVVFNVENIVQMVRFDTDKSKFESFFESLSKKYILVEKNIPFVGNKRAEFKADNCAIILNAPHMSFDMSVSYITTEYLAHIRKDINQAEENKKQTQDNAL